MKLDYDVIVVGSGPAGITSAIYLKRANINVCIMEKVHLVDNLINHLQLKIILDLIKYQVLNLLIVFTNKY